MTIHGPRTLAAIGVVLAVIAGCSGENGSNPPEGTPRLLILPPDTTIPVFGAAAYEAWSVSASGDTLPASSVTWSSSDTAIAAIDSTGLAVGKSPGTTHITVTDGTLTSDPATLRVAAGIGPCYGIATQPTFEGAMAWGYLAIDLPTEGGYLISADDNGSLHATMTQMAPSPFLVAWTGEAGGSASATQKKKDENGNTLETYNSTTGILLPQPVNGMPGMTLLVDLQQCTWRLVSAASVATVTKDQFGNLINSVDIIAQIQFAGVVPPDWRTAGLGRANGLMPAHSVFWNGTHMNGDALAPLGFAAQLFQGAPDEPAVGQASGGFTVTAAP